MLYNTTNDTLLHLPGEAKYQLGYAHKRNKTLAAKAHTQLYADNTHLAANVFITAAYAFCKNNASLCLYGNERCKNIKWTAGVAMLSQDGK